ncbi:hypothetical protein IPN41_00575 [Candidatus Falkowbacteria bacterium]|nr:MAG: hypothetical protein IPN41_00575 [Candidatus Falkowbacteria bacterium]
METKKIEFITDVERKFFKDLLNELTSEISKNEKRRVLEKLNEFVNDLIKRANGNLDYLQEIFYLSPGGINIKSAFIKQELKKGGINLS